MTGQMRDNPCKQDCPRRSSTCHTVCPDYAEWAKLRREELKQRAVFAEARQCTIESVIRTENKRR